MRYTETASQMRWLQACRILLEKVPKVGLAETQDVVSIRGLQGWDGVDKRGGDPQR